MEILKGAAAGSIYGARAGQGVILITTKSGHSGATVTTFRSQYGLSDVNRFPDLQRQYGEGTGGVADPCSSGQLGFDCLTDGFSWGQPLNGAPTYVENEAYPDDAPSPKPAPRSNDTGRRSNRVGRTSATDGMSHHRSSNAVGALSRPYPASKLTAKCLPTPSLSPAVKAEPFAPGLPR